MVEPTIYSFCFPFFCRFEWFWREITFLKALTKFFETFRVPKLMDFRVATILLQACTRNSKNSKLNIYEKSKFYKICTFHLEFYCIFNYIVFTPYFIYSWEFKFINFSNFIASFPYCSTFIPFKLWSIAKKKKKKIEYPVRIHEDNTAAIQNSVCSSQKSKLKFIELRFLKMKEYFESGLLVATKIETRKLLTDALTKPSLDSKKWYKKFIFLIHSQ